MFAGALLAADVRVRVRTEKRKSSNRNEVDGDGNIAQQAGGDNHIVDLDIHGDALFVIDGGEPDCIAKRQNIEEEMSYV